MFQTYDFSVTLYSDLLNCRSLLLNCQQLLVMMLYIVPWSLLLWLHGILILSCKYSSLLLCQMALIVERRNHRAVLIRMTQEILGNWVYVSSLMMCRWPSPNFKSLYCNTCKMFWYSLNKSCSKSKFANVDCKCNPGNSVLRSTCTILPPQVLPQKGDEQPWPLRCMPHTYPQSWSCFLDLVLFPVKATT